MKDVVLIYPNTMTEDDLVAAGVQPSRVMRGASESMTLMRITTETFELPVEVLGTYAEIQADAAKLARYDAIYSLTPVTFEGEVYTPAFEFTTFPRHLLEEERAEKIAAIKAGAEQQILRIAPEWKQRNLLARSIEITRMKIAGAATQAELDEEIAIAAIWEQVKVIRTASDNLEAQANAATTVAELDAIQI